ncbi:MAG: PAS domain-containing sensor histidine kinase [Candidatus Bathyarchaeia archaeon]|jgi:PAS domain S-box-containing protein
MVEIMRIDKGPNNYAPVEKEKDILQHMIDCVKNIHLIYLDRDFNFVRVNQAYAETCGYKPEEMIGKNHFDLYPDADNEAIFKRVRDTGIPAQFNDKPFTFPDQPQRGVTYWDWTLEPIKNNAGKVIGLVFSLVETTERKKSETKAAEYTDQMKTLVEERTRKLSAAASYTRSLIEASLDPLVTISPEGKITDVNNTTEAVTGCTREELIDSDFSNYFTEPEKAKAGYKKVLVDGLVRDYPLAIRHKSGKITDVLYNATVYTNEAGEMQGVFAAARDISALRKAEELSEERRKKLKDAERLAAIGATAGMVGHDIRNPLQAIASDVYLIKSDLDSSPECAEKASMRESLTGIEKNVDYIDKIVADLQDYARPIALAAQNVDLRSLLEEVLFKNRFPENIEATYKVEDEAAIVVADSNLFKRILNNLTINAMQAMPNGGKLAIRAYKSKDDLIITVKDTGVGIPEEVKDKLFTPMFTTKSKGQGFGLAVVKRMTEALGGNVAYESKVGKGTTFILHFPSNK